MFSAQDLLGFKSPVATPGSREGGLKSGKQGAALFQGGGANPETFKESLAQAAGKGQSGPQTGKTENAFVASKDVDKNDILQFLQVGLNPDHSNRLQEDPEKYSLEKLMQSIDEGFFQLNKAEARGRNDLPAGREGADLQGLLMRLLETFESAQSRIQEGNAAKADVLFQNLGFQSNAVSKTGQESQPKLGVLLEKVQQLLESSPGVKPGMQEITGESPGKTAEVRSEASLREQDFAWKQQSLPDRLQRVLDSVQTRSKEMSRLKEAGIDPRLRQFLNALAAESKNSLESGPGKNDPGLTGLLDQQGNLKNVSQLTENVFPSPSGGAPQVKPQSKQTVPDSIVQLQPGSGGSEKADNQSQPMRPSFTTSFDRNLQTMENRVVSQVFVRLFSGARQGSGNMTINMHPPELGKVKVRLVSDKGGLNVHLHSQNQQVLGILEKHLPTLQQSLEDQGVSLADLQVSVDSGNQDRPRFEDQDIWEAAGKKEQAGPAEEETVAGPSDQYRAGAGQTQGLSLRI